MTGDSVKSDERYFMGIRITDESCNDESSRRVIRQLSMEQFRPIVQAVLDDPTVCAFGWRQYTPMYNDGDPCEFTTAGFWVKPVDPDDLPEDGDDDEEDYQYEFPSYNEGYWLGKMDYDENYVGPDQQRYDRVRNLAHAIDGGQFDTVLREQFGENVRIRVTRDSVYLTEYCF